MRARRLHVHENRPPSTLPAQRAFSPYFSGIILGPSPLPRQRTPAIFNGRCRATAENAPAAYPAVAMTIPAKSHKAPHQRLLLTTTSLRNVVIANKTDVVYYEVVTPKWARGRTTVSRLDPNTRQFDIIGEVKNDDSGKAEEVSLYGGAMTPAGRFLEGLDSKK